jgi:hypothetical protein
MKYAVEMGLGAMIYAHAKFHKDWFKSSKFDCGGGVHIQTHTHRKQGDLISVLSFFSK